MSVANTDLPAPPDGFAGPEDPLFAVRHGDAGFFLRPMGVWPAFQFYGRCSQLYFDGNDHLTGQAQLGLRMVKSSGDKTFLRIVEPWARIEPLLRRTWLRLEWGQPHVAAKVLELIEPTLNSNGTYAVAITDDGVRRIRFNGAIVFIKDFWPGKGLVDVLDQLAAEHGFAVEDLHHEPMEPPIGRSRSPEMSP